MGESRSVSRTCERERERETDQTHEERSSSDSLPYNEWLVE